MSCKGSTALGNAFRVVFFSVGKITPGITYKRSITTITKNSDRSPISVGSRSIVLIRWTATPGKMLDIIENIRHVVFILELLSLPEEVHFATDDWLTKKISRPVYQRCDLSSILLAVVFLSMAAVEKHEEFKMQMTKGFSF